MAKANSNLTQEEIVAKEAEEKAKADALVKDLASKENDDKSPEDTSDKTQEEIAAKEAEDESAQDVPDDEKRTFEVYDHMVKYKGVFYNAGAKVPLE